MKTTHHRILIVEPYDELKKLIGLIFREHDCEVVEATGFDAGLEEAKKAPFDAVIAYADERSDTERFIDEVKRLQPDARIVAMPNCHDVRSKKVDASFKKPLVDMRELREAALK